MSGRFITWNGPMPTTAALAPVTTGTAIKTMLQLAAPSTTQVTVVEWGFYLDANAAATPIKVELIQTDVAATVTAHVAAGVHKYSDPNQPASLMTLGTAATGYTASAEGTITATRLLDYKLITPTAGDLHQYPLAREPKLDISRFLRVRVTSGVAYNMVCYIITEE